MDETPQDMADFIEYANGPADSALGPPARRRRPSRALPPPLPRTGQRGAGRRGLLPQSSSPWPRRSGPRTRTSSSSSAISPTASRFATRTTSAARLRHHQPGGPPEDPATWPSSTAARSGSTCTSAPTARGPTRPRRHVLSFIDALDKLADGAKHKVAVFEFNAGNHAQRRALANALAINCRRARRPHSRSPPPPTASSPTARTTTAGTRACCSSTRRRSGSSRPAT